MNESTNRLLDVLLRPSELWRLLREYFGLNRRQRLHPVADRDSLREFISTRASFIAQTSLYGYLRTRAGMRYPELFDDDVFVVSINIAKWQIWLACVADLAVYSGGLLMRDAQASAEKVSQLMQEVVTALLTETGTPADAGKDFSATAQQVIQRIASVKWDSVTDDEGPFSQSPRALVQWAPIVEDLKQLDEEIVINSVRFRWQKVRRDLRAMINTGAILQANS